MAGVADAYRVVPCDANRTSRCMAMARPTISFTDVTFTTWIEDYVHPTPLIPVCAPPTDADGLFSFAFPSSSPNGQRVGQSYATAMVVLGSVLKTAAMVCSASAPADRGFGHGRFRKYVAATALQSRITRTPTRSWRDISLLLRFGKGPGFWSRVQQGYANRICTSLPSSLRIA
jgi:hypothetical protein